MSDTVQTIPATSVKNWLSDGDELAFIDVREFGQYSAGHPFFSVNIPFSVFESRLPDMLPCTKVRLVLLDNNDGVASRAGNAAQQLGFSRVFVLEGGAEAWSDSGFTLFEGVNLPSKTFGEFLEHARNTPRISAAELARRQQAGEDVVVLDGRPYEEFRKMSIPAASCCPNGELIIRYSS